VYVFISHFAYSVVAAVIGVEKLNAFVNKESEYHPEKPYPVLVGAGVGTVAVELYATVWLATVLPPFALNVTVYMFIVHFAYNVIVAVIGVEKLNAFVNRESEHHPEKPYPVLVGAGVGNVAVELYATVWLLTALPPLLLNVNVYVPITHFA
jgi:uncharacterized short protein YbdD (DUF466 family)